jgi:hypothetical protein
MCQLAVGTVFYKKNHRDLLIKPMKRHLPANLLATYEHWLIHRVKRCDYISDFFHIAFGVRQGCVLSPILFAIYVHDIVK